MAKRKKKNRQNNRLRFIFLAIAISFSLLYLYTNTFRSPILTWQQINVKYETEEIMLPEKEETFGDLEIPESTTKRPEQIITHAGYTVSYNPGVAHSQLGFL